MNHSNAGGKNSRPECELFTVFAENDLQAMILKGGQGLRGVLERAALNNW